MSAGGVPGSVGGGVVGRCVGEGVWRHGVSLGGFVGVALLLLLDCM
jgi:hypothetical protein